MSSAPRSPYSSQSSPASPTHAAPRRSNRWWPCDRYRICDRVCVRSGHHAAGHDTTDRETCSRTAGESTMTWQSLFRYLPVGALSVLIALPAGAQSIVGKGKTGPVPNPVNLDTTGLFQAKFVRVGEDMFIGGQPTEKALRELKAKGVTTVVNLRMPEEMSRVGFDEAALVKELGI